MAQTKELQKFLKAAMPAEIERRETKQCPFCGKDMSNPEFRDEASRREGEISGICQECQDKTFAPMD